MKGTVETRCSFLLMVINLKLHSWCAVGHSLVEESPMLETAIAAILLIAWMTSVYLWLAHEG
jgi:hypothetical protein